MGNERFFLGRIILVFRMMEYLIISLIITEKGIRRTSTYVPYKYRMGNPFFFDTNYISIC